MNRRRKRGDISLQSLNLALESARGLPLTSRFQTRLVAWLIVLSAATSAVAGYVFYRRQLDFVRAEQERRGHTLINNLAGQSELGAYSNDRSFLLGPCQRAFIEPDVAFVAIYRSDGHELIRLTKPDIAAPQPLAAGLYRMLLADTFGHPRQRPDSNHIDFIAPIVSGKEDAEQSLFGEGELIPQVIGVARIGLSREPARQKLNEVLRAGIQISLVILAMGIVVALLLARRIAKPIMALARGADELRSGGLGFQINLRRRDELGLLAASFNRMSSQLRETVDSLNHLNRNLEVEVNRRTIALRRSRDFVTILNAPLELDRLLATALSALLRSTSALSGAIYLIERGRFELAAIEKVEAEVLAPSGPHLATLELAAESGHALVHNALPADLPWKKAVPQGQATLHMALDYRQQVHGVLALLLPVAIQAEHVDFVENAASQLAIAVSNARAYASAGHLARELEARNVALLAQRDQLTEVSRLKSEFLASISHELRTPLNGILGYTELITDGIYGEVNTDQSVALAGITESATNLLSLINQILDLSKVEAGQVPVEPARIELGRLIQDVVDSCRPLTRDRPYELSLDLPKRPFQLETDGAKVRQILINLLGNAIKFTAAGGVTVRLREGPAMSAALVQPEALAASQGTAATIEVADTGIGIKAEDLAFIFDEFRQVDGSFTREHGGTGLGLAISRKLASVIGATIRVDSTYGAGSTFSLDLPAGTRSPAASRSLEPGPAEKAAPVGEHTDDPSAAPAAS